MLNEGIKIFIEAVIMLTGVIAFIVSACQVKQQLKFSLFEKYTARFSQIMQSMPEEFFKEDVETLSEKKKEEINHYIRLYFDLCSEELYLYEQKRVDEKVWREWKGGIEDFFKNSLVRSFLHNYDKYHHAYNHFNQFINDEILNKDLH